MYKYLFFLFSWFVLVGCKEEEDVQLTQGMPAELPQASFYLTDKIVPVGYALRPDNNSAKAVSYEWDFGNGEKSVELNPVFHYNKPGTYTITLKAFNIKNEAHTVTTQIRVGEVYLVSLKLNKINFKNGANQPWDSDGSGPDIEFRVAPRIYGNQSPNWIFREHLGNNFTPASLPFTYKLKSPLKVYGNNLSYQLFGDLYYYGLFEMNGAVTNMEMFQTNSSPDYFDTQNGNSVLELPTPMYDMTLYYEVY